MNPRTPVTDRARHTVVSTKVHHIPPDKSLMLKVGASNFTLAAAVVELVANSVDAKPLDDRGLPFRPLLVDIAVNDENVIVVDNARGMTEDELSNAVRLGVNMDDFIGMRKRKGMYGLGLKTAAASIGRKWAVLTRPMGGTHDYYLEFDLETYRSGAHPSTADWTVPIITLERDAKSELGNRDSGTAVIIAKLRDSMPMSGAVLEYMGEAFKPHIESGDEIRVNGEAARPRQHDIVPDSRIEIDEAIGDPQKGWRVRGWVALDSSTHNDGKYGMNLYRENQLIDTWNKAWLKTQHLMVSRVVGEAHIDFMPVNHNKQGFTTQSEEWRVTAEHMKEVLDPVRKASQAANKNKNDPLRMRKAVQGMKQAIKAMSRGEPGTDQSGTDNATSNPSDAPATEVFSNKIVVHGHEVLISCEVNEWGSETTPWDYLPQELDGGARTEVHAVLNSNSQLVKQSADTKTLGLLAMADCVTRFLVETKGLTAREARELRDRWVHAALTGDGPSKTGDSQ